MNLGHLGHKDPAIRHRLQNLFRQSAQWRRFDIGLKQCLPVNLHPHFQVACIEDGCLVVLATNNMAATRLRMMLPALVPKLQTIDSAVQTVRVKIQPLQTPPPKTKQAHLSNAAKTACADAAGRLVHHPELAAALRTLSRKS